jgi:hypothetical protein
MENFIMQEVRQTFKKLSKIKNSVYDVEAEKKYFHKN